MRLGDKLLNLFSYVYIFLVQCFMMLTFSEKSSNRHVKTDYSQGFMRVVACLGHVISMGSGFLTALLLGTGMIPADPAGLAAPRHVNPIFPLGLIIWLGTAIMDPISVCCCEKKLIL